MEEKKVGTPMYKLSSGYMMPMLGLGTNEIMDPCIIANAINDLKYRTIDTATRYKNEHIVGDAINSLIVAGLVKREDLFVITKVWVEDMEHVEEACRKSLSSLGLDYIDLYLVHWPLAAKLVSGPEEKPPRYERVNIPIHKIWP